MRLGRRLPLWGGVGGEGGGCVDVIKGGMGEME